MRVTFISFFIITILSSCSSDRNNNTDVVCNIENKNWVMEKVEPHYKNARLWNIEFNDEKYLLNGEMTVKKDILNYVSNISKLKPFSYIGLNTNGFNHCSHLNKFANDIDAKFNCEENICFAYKE